MWTGPVATVSMSALSLVATAKACSVHRYHLKVRLPNLTHRLWKCLTITRLGSLRMVAPSSRHKHQLKLAKLWSARPSEGRVLWQMTKWIPSIWLMLMGPFLKWWVRGTTQLRSVAIVRHLAPITWTSRRRSWQVSCPSMIEIDKISSLKRTALTSKTLRKAPCPTKTVN